MILKVSSLKTWSVYVYPYRCHQRNGSLNILSNNEDKNMTNKCKRVIALFLIGFCFPLVAMTTTVNRSAEVKAATMKDVLYSSIV